jgi:GT2 family glycosyltransferase
MDLSIIIVNWNTKELLRGCLKSIRRSKTKFKYETIVVDNGSSDGSYKIKNKEIWIKNRVNLGMAAAVNQGIKKSKGRLILLLHPDTTIKQDTLDKVIRFSEKNPIVDIFGVKISYPDGTPFVSAHKYPSLPVMVIESLPIKYLFEGMYLRNIDRDAFRIVDIIPSACIFIQRKVFDKIGGFDRRFENWWSEWDFCTRAKKNGFNVIYAPITEIVHYEGMTFSHSKLEYNKKTKYKKYAYVNTSRMLRGLFLLHRKHSSGLSFMLLKWLTIAQLSVKIIRWMFYPKRVQAYSEAIKNVLWY